MNPLYETLNYDEHLKGLLQKKIKLILDDRVLRQGQLVLYGFKNFSIQLFFKANKTDKLRKTEIPIPFSIEKKDSNLILDYNPSKLFPKGVKLPEDLSKSQDKFLFKKLTIEPTITKPKK